MSSQRTRAAAVCMACHSRKVKCDLELKPNNRCSTCERRKQVCRPRRTAALRESQRNTSGLDPEEQLMGSPLNATSSMIREQASIHSHIEPEKQVGYIGEQSLMAGPRSEASPRTESAHLADINDRLLHVAGALVPPGKVVLDAAKDSYRLHVRSRVPVIEESDLALESLPIVLQQSLCLVHALLRRPGPSSVSVVPGEEYYIKVKTLLSTNYETNNVTALKAMCLLHCWNMSPPDIVTLDSSWACLGMAMRYALHLGLHKESTYPRLQSPRVARRMAWYLFVHDKIQTLCWQRPPMLPSKLFDVAPLGLSDFDLKDQDSLFFIYFTRLVRVLERLINLENNGPIQDYENVSFVVQSASFGILQMFVDWIKSLPLELSLYHSNIPQPFSLCVHELHIFYLVGLIVFCHHHCKSLGSHAASIIQLAASTMAARLYEEIDCRDQVTYLFSQHNWCLMVACIPQIGFQNTMYDEDQSCRKDLQILVAVLKQLADKWPPARRILNLVQKAWHPQSTVVSNEMPDSQIDGGGNLLMFQASSHEGITGIEAIDLFPFPDIAIPRLQSLSTCRLGTAVTVPGGFAPFDGSIDGIYDELIFDSNHTFPFG